MVCLKLNKYISIMLFHEKSYETLHVILLDFLYNLLTSITNLFILQGRKL